MQEAVQGKSDRSNGRGEIRDADID